MRAHQMQLMIQEIVGLLGDHASATAYELTIRRLASIIGSRKEAYEALSTGLCFQTR